MIPRVSPYLLLSLGLLTNLGSLSVLMAAEPVPLHQQIDAQFAETSAVPVASCSDAEFLRRVSLDLTGMPASADQVRAFLADEAPDKRSRLVATLLDSPDCDRQLTSMLDLMLMERRRNQHVPQNDWHQWLLTAVQQRRPWNDIVRDILQADGDTPELRPAARFFLDRESEPHLLTRDVGRIFFGRDMQCAQCHDHPLIDDYRQADYHGLHAFLAPGYPVVRKIKKKEGDKETTVDMTVYAEKAGTDLTFESVFFAGTTRRTGPRLPDELSITESFQLPGDEYEVAPAEGVKSVPRVSRRQKLAELATSGGNRMFNENMANRLWAHMLGRGLVHPVDLHHFDNPPTHPELLKLLGEHFAASNFDIRGLLGQIALSQVYQRSFDAPADLPQTAANAAEVVAAQQQQRVSLEQTVAAATSGDEAATSAWEEAQDKLVPVAAELDTARKAYDEARKALAAAEAELAKPQAELKTKQTALPAVQQAAEAAQQAVAQLADSSDLKAAAELFQTRSQELQASIGQLTKDVASKQAALEKPTSVLAEKKTAVEGGRAKLEPLVKAVQQAETDLLQKRRAMQQQVTALNAVEARLETLQQLAGVPELQQAISQADTARRDSLGRREQAKQQLAVFVPMIEQRQTAVEQMKKPLAEATQRVEQATAVRQERAASVQAVQAALDAVQQAEGRLPDDPVLAEVTGKLTERLKPLQLAMTDAQAQLDAMNSDQQKHREAHEQAVASLDQAVTEREQQQSVVQTREQEVVAAEQSMTEAQAAMNTAVDSLVDHWSTDFTVAALKPLTPEQLCWSMWKATGSLQRQRQRLTAKLDQEQPLTDEQKQDQQALQARAATIEKQLWDSIQPHQAAFVKYFGAGAGQPQNDFFATADQALYTANAGTVNSWISPSHGNVTQRMLQAETSAAAAEELYLGILNRFPREEEVQEVAAVLEQPLEEPQKIAAASELVWALLTSIEFRFNH